MNLTRKLSEVPREERDTFLKWKYRELQLVKQVDRLTDRYLTMGRLIRACLEVIHRFFGCEIAGFQILGGGRRKDGGFFFSKRRPGNEEELRTATREILNGYLSEPFADLLVNEPVSSLQAKGLRNYLVYPMAIKSQLEGAFFLANRDWPFDENDLHFIAVISSQLDNGVVHARVLEEQRKANAALQQRARELEALYEMSLSLSFGYDFETLAQKVLQSAMTLVSVDRISIMVYDQKSDELRTMFVLGEKQKIRLVKLGMGKGIAGLALLSRKPIVAPLGAEDERFVPFEFPSFKPRKIFSLISIPLLAGEKPLGVMNFSILTRKKVFSGKDLETLSVAAHLISLALQRQQFYQLSIKDELTDLFTFRYFKERLAEEANRARRYKMSFSLLILDLDRFKSINDTYGHPFGNVVLQAVAGVLHHTIRNGVDMAARFGGEEMALILPHTGEQGAFILAERIRTKVEALVLEHEGKPVKVTVSGGLATFPTHGETAEELLEAADAALYRSKEEGRNRMTVAEMRIK
ncbi:MAG: Response regulator/GGDEF domain protein [Candidatus Ozemobacter sibiricus]|uniref:Response regulator/GGDEF domain protein n=1 Tax=Candidatus Ozemobacter sibiricus TaxID=2268124 RepID=A0A367ZKC6_9BACT|nr:MAG: Response regulator/GGDEF domain protein [Candidatus Ozemobacter sibiricus]